MIKKEQQPDNFKFKLIFNIVLAVVLAIALIVDSFKIYILPQATFAALSVIGLLPVLWSAGKALIKKELTIDLLASVALIFSFLTKQWYSATFINLMLSFARIFDFWTEIRTKNIIGHLMKYRPIKVKIKEGDRIIEKPVEHLKIGDEIIIESGERIPVDGVVISGQASIDEATLTGESMLVEKKVGDKVFSSTLNETGSLLVRAEKIGKDSTLEKIITLVEEASRKKAGVERVADKFTKWYIILTIIGSILLYYFSHNMMLVLSILLVVCADDIAVAVPLSFTTGIARAAQLGIIIKGSNVMESLPKIDYFLTDKTGTLTYGKPKIKKIEIFSKITEVEFLKTLAVAVINSNHPISKAIINYVREKNIDVLSPDQFHETPGEGMEAEKNSQKIIAGKIKFLEDNGFKISEEEKSKIEEAENIGYGITAMGIDKKFIGFIAFEDELRSFSKHLSRALKELGVKTLVMLTGDNERVASRVTKELGIDKFKSGLKPEQKLKYMEDLKKESGGILAMVGDGVNDAAALALADVSFAMGAIGSDAAIEAADVALMKDDLRRVPDAIMLSKRVKKAVVGSFWIWGITNAVGLFLVIIGVLGPAGAATYNFMTDFLPIANALSINFFTPKKEL